MSTFGCIKVPNTLSVIMWRHFSVLWDQFFQIILESTKLVILIGKNTSIVSVIYCLWDKINLPSHSSYTFHHEVWVDKCSLWSVMDKTDNLFKLINYYLWILKPYSFTELLGLTKRWHQRTLLHCCDPPMASHAGLRTIVSQWWICKAATPHRGSGLKDFRFLLGKIRFS